MSLTKCDECGYEITMKTNTCPICGESISRAPSGFQRLIYRIILILLAIYIFLAAMKYF
jgi:hypothetical protein